MVFSADSSPDSIKFNRKKIFANRFPTIDVTLVNEKNITIPNHYIGKPSVIYVAGPTSSQQVLDSWSAPLRQLFSTNVNHLELLFPNDSTLINDRVEKLKSLIHKESHDVVGLSHVAFNDLKKSLLLYATDFVFVFVLDKDGHIVYSQPGPCTEFQLFRIKNVIKNVLETNVEELRANAKHLKRKRKALVVGGTGLVGSCVLNLLLQDSMYSQVHMAVRKPSTMFHPKLVEHLVNFDKLNEYKHMFDVDDVFCCLGTTLKQAKTKAMQTKIDRDYCITIAKLASQMTCEHFILVSSIGANALSKSFYLRLKGELEDAVKTCSFKQCYIFQPSVLLGLRKTFRLGEYISKVVLLCLTPFLIGPFAKFRAISALMLAKAMTNAAKLGSDSATFTYNDIKTYAKSEINE